MEDKLGNIVISSVASLDVLQRGCERVDGERQVGTEHQSHKQASGHGGDAVQVQIT